MLGVTRKCFIESRKIWTMISHDYLRKRDAEFYSKRLLTSNKVNTQKNWSDHPLSLPLKDQQFLAREKSPTEYA